MDIGIDKVADVKEASDREALERISDTRLIKELFSRGLARQIEHRVFMDGLQLRASALPEEQHEIRGKAQAVQALTKALLEEGVIAFEAQDAGPDYSPGSKRYVALMGVLL